MNKKNIQKKKGAQIYKKEKILAVLGPKNTYTDMAAEKYRMLKRTIIKKEYFHTIGDVFGAVEKGKAEEGIIPLENMIYGSVRETYDDLFNSNVHIREKLKINIKHSLVTLPGTKKSDIHVIASHEQALQQCREYLKKHFPFAQKEYCTSTMAALQKMIDGGERGMAVIVPVYAAQGLPLKILAKNLENQAKNVTTFIVIKKGPCTEKIKGGPCRLETAIAFYFREDSPGRLYMVFREFAASGINLSHIESRPSLKQVGNYVFFLNFDGSAYDKKAAAVLKSIESRVAKLKILGVYKKT